MTSQHENKPNRTGLMGNICLHRQRSLQGWFLTSCWELGELELTPERLPVVLVDEVVNALLDHVRLGTERQDSPHSQVHRSRSSSGDATAPHRAAGNNCISADSSRGEKINKDHIRLHAFCVSCNVIFMCDSNRDVIVRTKSAELPKRPTADARLLQAANLAWSFAS